MRTIRLIPVLVLSVILLLPSCSDKDNGALQKVPYKDGEISRISLKKINSEVRDIKLSELLSDFQVIPLETSEECPISNTWITFCENSILVGTQHFPDPAMVYRFDKNGHFLNAIGKPGKGPAEHTGYAIASIKAYENSRRVLVRWQAGQKGPQLFGYDGSFIEEIEQPYRFSYIDKWSDSIWVSPGHFAGKIRRYRDSIGLVFYNSDGKILKQIPRREYPPENFKGYTPTPREPSLYQYNDQWRLYMDGNDTIFGLDNMNLHPVAVLAPDKNILPFNESISPGELPGRYRLNILRETDNNWFINKEIIEEADLEKYKPGQWSAKFKTKNLLIILDKKSNSAIQGRLTDDLFHLFPERYLNHLLEWQEGRITLAIPPIRLKKLLKKSNVDKIKNEKAKEVIDKIREIPEDNNPVIFSFTLKEHFKIHTE